MEKKEIEWIQDHLKVVMNNHSNVISFLALLFCTITIGLVIIFSFKVTMTISKPLKKLIKVADIINNKITEEKALQEIRDEIQDLPEV